MTLPRPALTRAGVVAVALLVLATLTGCFGPKADAQETTIPFNREGGIHVLVPAAAPAGHPALAEELRRAFRTEKVDAAFSVAATAGDQLLQFNKARKANARVLVVAAVDQHLMKSPLEQAIKEGRSVVCVGARPISKTMCTLFIGWDDFATGWDEAQALKQALKTAKPDPGRPWNVEMFGLDRGIKSAEYRHKGAIDSLKPHKADSDVLIKTGQTSYVQVAVPGSNPGALRRHLATTIEATYLNQPLDGLVLPDDGMIAAARSAVTAMGIEMPVMVSTGCSLTGATALRQGEIAATTFADPHWLADEVARAVAKLRRGEAVTTSPRRMDDMGLKKTPSILLTPLTVTKANAPQTLKNAPLLLAAVQGK